MESGEGQGGGGGGAGVESGEGRGGGVVGRDSARVDLVARERGSKGIWRGRGRIARGKLTNGAPHLGAPLECFFITVRAQVILHLTQSTSEIAH